MVMKNIIIGTAGWRMKYGNSHKILSTEEISALIHHFKSINIRSFDTASNYGDAENILFTQLGKNNFVDTKLESFSDLNVFKKLLAQKTKLPINVLYFHDPKVFEKFSSRDLNQCVRLIRQNGFAAGFSIYDKKDIVNNLQFFNAAENKIQLPSHIFDLTILDEAIKRKLKPKNVNLRSFFARGLLFLSSNKIKKILGKKYLYVKNGFEEVYNMSFTPENSQMLSYSLINYLTSRNFGCIVGLNSIEEVNFFIGKCDSAKKHSLDWEKIISCSNKLIDIQEINL